MQLWTELYGTRVMLEEPPGNKSYLLLQRQIHAKADARRTLWYRSDLPSHWWPARITHSQPGEGLGARLARYRIEAGFVLTRLRFDIRTSVPFMLKSLRWRRMTGAGR